MLKGKALPHEVKFYVPSITKHGESVTLKMTDEVVNAISKRFPEFTWYEARGIWEGQAEHVFVIEIYAEYVKHQGILEIVEVILDVMEQQAVAYVVDGQMWIFTEKDKEENDV
jgi:hypothetical protein